MSEDVARREPPGDHPPDQPHTPDAQALEPLISAFRELPDEARQMFSAVMHMESASGLLPPPTMFAGYADVVPDAPERILRMAEKQEDHRHAMERTVVQGGDRRANRGQWLAFALAIFFGLIATLLVLTGHDLAGAVIGSTTVLGLVAVFVGGRRRQARDTSSRHP